MHLRIPLQGSRLVQCTIDGDQVLPEPDGPNAILDSRTCLFAAADSCFDSDYRRYSRFTGRQRDADADV